MLWASKMTHWVKGPFCQAWSPRFISYCFYSVLLAKGGHTILLENVSMVSTQDQIGKGSPLSSTHKDNAFIIFLFLIIMMKIP